MTRARPVLVAVLLLALPLAGCLDAIQSGVRAREPKPEDHAAAWSDFAVPGLSRAYDFPVEEGALSLRVDAHLATASALPEESPATPAQIELSVRDATGGPVGPKITLTPQSPRGSLTLTEFAAFGTYVLAVTGHGLSGQGQGARYNATVQVDY